MRRNFMEITLKEFFTILRKGIVFIISISLVFAVCSFFVSNYFIQERYTTSVKLYVDIKTDSKSSNNYNNYNYAVSLVNSYKEMLETNKFYNMLEEDLDNEFTAKALSNAINFSPLNNTEIFEAVVVANSAEDAKKIADSVAENAPRFIFEFDQVNSLKIADEAILPTAPSSPNVIVNTGVAFVVGFILAVLIVFIRKVFDVKIRYDENLTTICGVPVLSAIPDLSDRTSDNKR